LFVVSSGRFPIVPAAASGKVDAKEVAVGLWRWVEHARERKVV
jgi:hypothetical protein